MFPGAAERAHRERPAVEAAAAPATSPPPGPPLSSPADFPGGADGVSQAAARGPEVSEVSAAGDSPVPARGAASAVPVAPPPLSPPYAGLAAPIVHGKVEVVERSRGEARGARKGRRRLLLWALGAAAVVVLLVAALLTVPAILRTPSPSDPALAGPLTPAPTATPTVAPIVVDPADGPADFMSASKNIRCHLDDKGVLCAVIAVAYKLPNTECTDQAVASAVALRGSELTYSCVTQVPAESDVLERDVPYVYGDYTCTLTGEAGATCVTTEGVGFRLSAARPLVTLPTTG